MIIIGDIYWALTVSQALKLSTLHELSPHPWEIGINRYPHLEFVDKGTQVWES